MTRYDLSLNNSTTLYTVGVVPVTLAGLRMKKQLICILYTVIKPCKYNKSWHNK